MFTRISMALLFVVAVSSGFYLAFWLQAPVVALDATQSAVQAEPVAAQVSALAEQAAQLDSHMVTLGETTTRAQTLFTPIRETLQQLIAASEQERDHFAAQTVQIDSLVAASEQHAQQTNDVLDTVLAGILGKPIGQTYGERATIKIFSLQEAGYQGYMAKVKLHDPSAVKLVLSNDKVGDKGETPSAAAKRTGAIFAINGGGFARGSDGLLYPMGITVVDGEVKTFYRNDLSFIGLNRSGQLVGGDITTQEQLAELEIMHGATFVPTLLKGGEKLDIPDKWKNKKEPRTLIGHFTNGDLLFVVIDGRQKGYSEGVTLEEAQEKLLEFKVQDAYNLDGGGSSAFYYDGNVLNRPSDGKQRAVASSFVINP